MPPIADSDKTTQITNHHGRVASKYMNTVATKANQNDKHHWQLTSVTKPP